MTSKKKRKRSTVERPSIHPRNKYSDNPPGFGLLASLYPTFEPFVFYSSDGRPRIDWTDFNATRELSRVLLLHDHVPNWWYTSLVGRKSNLKILISKLREVGVTIVKTTEFVQGQTCRWGLAWSFKPPARKIISSHVAEKNVLSFTLEGLQRKYSAIHVFESVESFFCIAGASCKSNASAFTIDITASNDHCDTILKNELRNIDELAACQYKQVMSNASCCLHLPLNDLSFRISVFQQIPGTLLVRGSLQHKESLAAGMDPIHGCKKGASGDYIHDSGNTSKGSTPPQHSNQPGGRS